MRGESSRFERPNRFVLAAIVDASATTEIVALRDVVDERGAGLWSSSQPVSLEFEQCVQGRRLRAPIEICLDAKDGVTASDLHAEVRALLQADGALPQALLPWAAVLLDEVQRIPVHGVARLLLTVQRAARPSLFMHSVHAMALAGALAAHAGRNRRAVRTALLAGLLHDLGEIYIDPLFFDITQALGEEQFRSIATHPGIGEGLLTELTDYPASLATAVGKHHRGPDEHGEADSPASKADELGRTLYAAETILGVLGHGKEMPWTRADVALTLVPGEFDSNASAFIGRARKCEMASSLGPVPPWPADPHEHQHLLEEDLRAAANRASSLAVAGSSDVTRRLADRAAGRLTRLQVACGECARRAAVRDKARHSESNGSDGPATHP